MVGARGAVIKEIKAKSGVEDLIVGNRDEIRRIEEVRFTEVQLIPVIHFWFNSLSLGFTLNGFIVCL